MFEIGRKISVAREEYWLPCLRNRIRLRPRKPNQYLGAGQLRNAGGRSSQAWGRQELGTSSQAEIWKTGAMKGKRSMKTKSGMIAKTTASRKPAVQLKPRHQPKRPLQARSRKTGEGRACHASPARSLVGEAHGLSQKQANEVLAGTIALIGEHLKRAPDPHCRLGTLEVRKRSARMGRNPATGEAIEIKASKKVAFRAAKDLSEAI